MRPALIEMTDSGISGSHLPPLICVKILVANTIHHKRAMRETAMPIESALVTVFVVLVFAGFALVLAWAGRQTHDR